MDNLTLAELIQTFPHDGKLVWLGLRTARGKPICSRMENLTVLPVENLLC